MAADKETLERIGARTRFVAGEKQAEIARKGAAASAQAKRRKASLNAALRAILNLACTDPDMLGRLADIGMETDQATWTEAVASGMVIAAANGDTKAFQLLRDATNENPAIELQKKELKLREKETATKKEDIVITFEGAGDEGWNE